MVASIIARKRDGHELTDGQIHDFIRGFSAGEIADYQMSALAMAIYLNGMTDAETATLTEAMLQSGVQMEHPASAPPIVDKHSTGGVGDKTSLILAPLLACCDLWVPMISGRGLGPTGGTLDKLESIPGFRTDLSLDEIGANLQSVGCVITGATSELASADKRLYSLRDVTATVASIPLITASIMSKKLAEGLDALVLDVKCGNGAFMKTPERAEQLAKSLVSVGRSMGVTTSALITDMNQPLGRMVGNSVEVDEAIDVLAGKPNAPEDLTDVTLKLGAQLLLNTDRCKTAAEAEQILRSHIESGAGLEKLEQMIAAQSGDCHAQRRRAIESQLLSDSEGYVASIHTEQIGQTIIALGGGRRVATDKIDPSVGLKMLVRLGDHVAKDQPLVSLFTNGNNAETTNSLRAAIDLTSEPPAIDQKTIQTI